MTLSNETWIKKLIVLSNCILILPPITSNAVLFRTHGVISISFVLLTTVVITYYLKEGNGLPAIYSFIEKNFHITIHLCTTFNIVWMTLFRREQFRKLLKNITKVNRTFAGPWMKKTNLFPVFMLYMLSLIMYYSSDCYHCSNILSYHECFIIYSSYIATIQVSCLVFVLFTLMLYVNHQFTILNKKLIKLFKSNDKQNSTTHFWQHSPKNGMMRNSLLYEIIPQLFFRNGELANMQKIIDSHNKICDAVDSLNSIFGISILLFFIQALTGILRELSFAIALSMNVLHERVFESPGWFNVSFIFPVLQVLFLAYACEGAVKGAKNISVTSIKFHNMLQGSPISHEVQSLKDKLSGLLHQVETRKPEYTAAGFFTINYSLVARIGALVISEVVVIIQCVNDKNDC